MFALVNNFKLKTETREGSYPSCTYIHTTALYHVGLLEMKTKANPAHMVLLK